MIRAKKSTTKDYFTIVFTPDYILETLAKTISHNGTYKENQAS